jgi:hypothetical protein
MYQYVGTLINGIFKLGKKSKISGDAQSVKVFNYVSRKLKSNELPEFIEIWHEGKCGRCGRTLTVPTSIESGMGPECSKMNSKQLKRDALLTSILKKK